jgi:NAD(P)-dependent dehydrogenase (short-subunit alcohol dehydrogenase family)
MSFRNRVVAITGGARGIGRETARALAERGATVVIGDLDVSGAEAVAAELPRATGLELDVRDAGSFERFVETAGELDVLVNNAGIMPLGPFLGEPGERTRQQLDVNLWGVIVGMRAALPGMVQRGHGQIVNVASMGGRFPLPGAATYTATKAGVIGLTEAVRHELRGSGVTLTALLPAMVHTELATGVPGGRGLPAVPPERVAAAIVGAIERRRSLVFVPGWLRYADAALGLAPRALVDVARRRLGDDRVLRELDVDARRSYEERLAAEAVGPR